jgi:hypothetical protein
LQLVVVNVGLFMASTWPNTRFADNWFWHGFAAVQVCGIAAYAA